MIEKIVVLSRDEAIHLSDLPKELFQITPNHNTPVFCRRLDDALEETEREMVRNAYKKHKTSVGVAKALGISQPKAYRLLRKYIDGMKLRD